MKQSYALKTVLIYWATYIADGDREPGSTSLFDLVGETPPQRFKTAMLVLTGKQYPDDDEVETFIHKYGDWMLAVYHNLTDIMLGTTTIDEVLVEQTINKRGV